jgi:hypothetical protein
LRRKLDVMQLELATARKDLESVTADRNRWQEGYRYQVELLQTELARSDVDVAALVAGVREELSFWHRTHPRGLSLTEVTQHNVVAHNVPAAGHHAEDERGPAFPAKRAPPAGPSLRLLRHQPRQQPLARRRRRRRRRLGGGGAQRWARQA